MDQLRPSFRCSDGDRRLEIVSGKGRNQIYVTNRPRSPEIRPVPQRVARRSQESSSAAASATKPWGFTDPEMKRRKRIAKYKVYTIEGRVKTSIRNGFRWIKNKCAEIIHGY